MEGVIRDWFGKSHRSLTVLNIFTVSMIVSEMDNKDEEMTDKLEYAKSVYPDIIDIILKDGKINKSQAISLIDQYDVMNKDGTIDEFSSIIADITNKPNLINAKWIPDNKCGRARNRCFPCQIVSRIGK